MKTAEVVLPRDRLTSSLKPYWSERASLAVVNNLLFKDSRIVIPSAMRLEVLDKLHERNHLMQS